MLVHERSLDVEEHKALVGAYKHNCWERQGGKPVFKALNVNTNTQNTVKKLVKSTCTRILHVWYASFTSFFFLVQVCCRNRMQLYSAQNLYKDLLNLHQNLTQETCARLWRWRRSVVVSGVGLINEVNQHRARLVLGWVTVCGQVNHLGM